MKVQKSITVPDTNGNPGVTLTLDEDAVTVRLEGIRFSPPVVPLRELDLAVMALRGESNGEEH